jgi:hypothetical protein
MPVPVLSKPIPPVAAPPKVAAPAEEPEPTTTKRAALPEEEPATSKRAVVDDPHPPIAPPRAPEPPPIAPAPTGSPMQRELVTEPSIHAPPAAPLEVTDHVALPAEPIEPDDVALPGARSRGATWVLIGGALFVALLLVSAAAAWRLGLFTPAPVTSVPLPPTSIAAPPTSIAAPPTSIAPPTSVAAPPTSTAPPTSVAETPPATDVVAPPTSIEAPPTSVVPEPPPETVVADVAPPVTDVAPPDATEEETDTEDATSDSPPPGRGDEAQRLVDRANFLRSHGDLPGAEADYLRVLRLSPNNARAMAGLARLHLARHDARTASTWARRLAEGHLPNAGNYVLLGDALQASGDTAGARRAWEHALEISPGYRDARRRLGR